MKMKKIEGDEMVDGEYFDELDTRKLVLANGSLADITMTNWHWTIYDWLVHQIGWSKRLMMRSIEALDEDGLGPSAMLAYYLVVIVDKYQENPEGFNLDADEAAE